MPPKKRDKDVDPTKNPRMDHINADHELFLQAFEKPTQIYRYLRTRNMCSPIFLNRTLTYMRYRMTRNHKAREGFKLESLLDQLSKARDQSSTTLPGFMNLTFLGFHDNKHSTNASTVQIEAALVRFSHSKRKDSTAPSLEVSYGIADVAVNPLNYGHDPEQLAPTISIPTDTFSLTGRPTVKSYMLVVSVNKEKAEDDVSFIKQNPDDEPALKRPRKSVPPSAGSDNRRYVSELIVYDKYSRCLLTDADYELVLQEVSSGAAARQKASPRKYSSWENVSELGGECCLGGPDTFSQQPYVKFKLNWSQEPAERLVKVPPLYPLTNDTENGILTNGTCATNGVLDGPPKLQIVYQFVYNNNSRQQTEACEDLHCPWCSVNCNELYTLLKHLKLCHSRFTFTYVPLTTPNTNATPTPQIARIDVAINELYDGSYAGAPQDLVAQPTPTPHVIESTSISDSGVVFGVSNSATVLSLLDSESDISGVSGALLARGGPVRRRASVTHILVCHPPRKVKNSLAEFLELDDCEYDGQRPFITGHNRLYHHTTTCLPIYPKEMDVDSEGENDPEWLRSKTLQMIDEFTDVNEGEKELMKMWNLHVMKYGFVGDCQIPVACQMFVHHRGKELLMKNLYRNFVVHMSSLFDFGLISAVCHYTVLKKLQDLVGETVAIRTILKESREKQMDNWSKYGSQQSTQENKPSCSKTPVRKISVGMQRRKGTPTPNEAPTRRKSINSERKRMSLSLKQPESAKGVS